ncbi:MAG: SH3 domain-containing protein [Propionibacteriaceae bacterium]|nr:SH3 domain-containing protein [Propionibacteriaceae bacterium]
MATARRANTEVSDVTTSTASPQPGRVSRVGAALRKGLPPAAIVGLLAITMTLTFVPMGKSTSTSVADPLAAYETRVANRASREFARVPNPATLSTFDTSPTAVVPSPSPSPAPVVTESVVPVIPTPAPSVAPLAPPTVVAEVVVPKMDWSIRGEKAGVRWASSSVNVRKGPGTDHDVVTTLGEGRKVAITASENDGWRQVSLKNSVGWVKATFLTDVEPVAPTKVASSSTSSKKDSSSTSSKKPSGSSEKPAGNASSAGTCSKAGNAENGMKSNTVKVLRKLCAQFSSITSYGGYRAGSSGYHGSGRAIDAMISGDAGWDVANWARANASSLGVVEVIYQQKIWTTQRSGDGWRSMSDRGGATANHYDHVHISVG